MKYFTILILATVAYARAGAQDPRCVGDHHEGCPVLVVKEAKVSTPGCDQSQISHGDAQSLFKGSLGWQNGANFRPVTDALVLRECLDDRGDVVRSCPMKFTFAVDGAFTQEVWRKHVDESICRNGVVTSREYEEKVQLRFQAVDCEDLVVPFTWPSEPKRLMMKCKG
jgi:hypothetical protein